MIETTTKVKKRIEKYQRNSIVVQDHRYYFLDPFLDFAEAFFGVAVAAFAAFEVFFIAADCFFFATVSFTAVEAVEKKNIFQNVHKTCFLWYLFSPKQLKRKGTF